MNMISFERVFVHVVRCARGAAAAAYGLGRPCMRANDDVVKDGVGCHAVLTHFLDDLERLAECGVAVLGFKALFASYRATLRVWDLGA